MDIYVFRHGETDYNAAQRFQGHTDIPLNAKGLEQARRLAEKLGNRGIQHVYSSPLQRALATGRAVAELAACPITTEDDLREIHCGDTEGMLRTEAIALYGEDFWSQWISLDEPHMELRFRGGESKRECQARAMALVQNLLIDNRHRTIALSMHGAVLRYLLRALLGPEHPLQSIPNCACYHLAFDRTSLSWSCVDLNESHGNGPISL